MNMRANSGDVNKNQGFAELHHTQQTCGFFGILWDVYILHRYVGTREGPFNSFNKQMTDLGFFVSVIIISPPFLFY